MNKGKKKTSSFQLVNSVMVLWKKVMWSENHTNIVLGRALGSTQSVPEWLKGVSWTTDFKYHPEVDLYMGPDLVKRH